MPELRHQSSPDATFAMRWEERYHVPRSQVWEGSRGGQQGGIHLHLKGARLGAPGVTLVAVVGRRTKIRRGPGQALCAHTGWYERRLNPGDQERYERCRQCAVLAERYGVEWPEPRNG